MQSQNKEVDVESLQKCDRGRGRCLDVFLVSSVVFLFATVISLGMAGVMAMKQLQSQHSLQSSQVPEYVHARLTAGGTPSPAFKMENFASLEPTSMKLVNTTLNWTPVHYGEGTSLGSKYEFNKHQSSLKPQRVGSYFMFINVNIKCIGQCKAGILNLSVPNKLSCDVELPAHKTSVSKKCWTVRQFLGERMVIKMTVPEGGLENWKLDGGTSFGIFLVD